jgi:hypothetical protein
MLSGAVKPKKVSLWLRLDRSRFSPIINNTKLLYPRGYKSPCYDTSQGESEKGATRYYFRDR